MTTITLPPDYLQPWTSPGEPIMLGRHMWIVVSFPSRTMVEIRPALWWERVKWGILLCASGWAYSVRRCVDRW
jgi:hypothetical protein